MSTATRVVGTEGRVAVRAGQKYFLPSGSSATRVTIRPGEPNASQTIHSGHKLGRSTRTNEKPG